MCYFILLTVFHILLKDGFVSPDEEEKMENGNDPEDENDDLY